MSQMPSGQLRDHLRTCDAICGTDVVFRATSLWRVATPLCSGQVRTFISISPYAPVTPCPGLTQVPRSQVVTGSISPEVGCNVLYCANLLADSKSLSVVFRVYPRSDAPQTLR